MIVKRSSFAGVKPSVMTKFASLSVTEPVTLSWSYCGVGVRLVPFNSTLKFEPLDSVTLPVLRMPGLVPGETVPPLTTLTEPGADPVPPKVPLLLTLTALLEEIAPFTLSCPPLTVVAPV